MGLRPCGHDSAKRGEKQVKQVIEYLQSFAVIGLVLFGIGGISYNLFRDEGWIENILGNLWDAGIEYPLIAVPTIVAAAVLGKLWRDHRLALGRTSKLPDYFIYVLMATGVYFIGSLFIRGTL